MLVGNGNQRSGHNGWILNVCFGGSVQTHIRRREDNNE